MKKIFILFSFLILICSAAEAQRIKFYEAFDSLNVEQRGWKLINNDSSIVEYPPFFTTFDYYELGTLSPQVGNYFIKYNSLNANERGLIDEWVILPQFSHIEKYDTLSFWCGAIDKAYKDSIRVYISTSDNNISSFLLIDNFKANGPAGAWYKKKYSFSAYAGKSIYFAINYHIQDGGPYGANSDNVWMGNFKVTNPFGEGTPALSFSLAQNFPNPFNPSTDIVFNVPSQSKVTLKVYDLSGKEVAVLANGNYNPGSYVVSWNASNLASGVYFYKLIAGSFIDSKKMVLVK